MKRYFDELNEAGMIPVSMISWQLTGRRGEFMPEKAMPR